MSEREVTLLANGVKNENAPVICSIGTIDPWNAAGLGLDIRTIAEAGGRPVTVVAGLSAQGPDGVRDVRAVDAAFVRAQLASLASADIAAYRIGALVDIATSDAIARHLAGVRVPVVYDPVLRASAGGRFAPPDFAAHLIETLLPNVTLATPNAFEARELAGLPPVDARDIDASMLRELALRLRLRSGVAILVTGGDAADEPIDVLADERGTAEFRDARIPTTMRGTGCILAAVTSVELARGVALREAIARARAFVRKKLRGAIPFGGANVAY